MTNKERQHAGGGARHAYFLAGSAILCKFIYFQEIRLITPSCVIGRKKASLIDVLLDGFEYHKESIEALLNQVNKKNGAKETEAYILLYLSF